MEEYNKGQISRAFLVRNVNQRFKEFTPSDGTSICPFRSSGNETHAYMTGSIRREAVHFLWAAATGLQLLQRQDDDVLLKAALARNQLKFFLRRINQCARRAQRTVEDIDAVKNVAFCAGLYFSQALGLPVNTKMHRIMHNIKNHLIRFGNARHVDSDMNETIPKETKLTYRESNRRVLQLTPQIITMRTASIFTRNYKWSMLEQELSNMSSVRSCVLFQFNEQRRWQTNARQKDLRDTRVRIHQHISKSHGYQRSDEKHATRKHWCRNKHCAVETRPYFSQISLDSDN